MTLQIPERPNNFVVDTASERDTQWHDGSTVYVKDEDTMYILDDGGWQKTQQAIPSGGIIMWSGAISDIPTNWVICDGTNDTPDLTDRFVIHADADSAGTRDVGDTGGANAYDLEHTHAVGTLVNSSVAAHVHGGASGGGEFLASGTNLKLGSAGAHSHTITGDIGDGGSATQATIPKFYALAYIMKT